MSKDILIVIISIIISFILIFAYVNKNRIPEGSKCEMPLNKRACVYGE